MNRQTFLQRVLAVLAAAVAMLLPRGVVDAARARLRSQFVLCACVNREWLPFYTCWDENTICILDPIERYSWLQAYQDWDCTIPWYSCGYGWLWTGGCCRP